MNPTEMRFWTKVEKGAGCWEWQGSRLTGKYGGYGQFSANGHRTLAHRFAYEITFGPIPQGQSVCHHCDNPPCVRPSHLFRGVQRDNVLDMSRKGRARGGVSGDNNPRRLNPPRGEKNPRARLTAEDIATIRARYAAGGTTCRALGAEYGVHNSHISRIVRETTWTPTHP